MWMIDKEDNRICYADGNFHTITRDWNYDGDVYSDTVMVVHYLGGEYCHIHRYDMEYYEVVSTEYVVNRLRKELDEYFLKGDGYYCDPTYDGYHYGDYRFMKGGRCIYEDESHRKRAIEKEINYIIGRVLK